MIDRRAFLATLTGAVLPGCSTSGTGETPTVTTTGTRHRTRMKADSENLDLREANVVEVTFDGTSGEAVTFDVSLFHDDDGEDGYANWWQVETLDGTRLGRRELLHAHSTDPFTRSATIQIPEDVDCVVVRGHDQTHGYGGRVILVNLESGAMRATDQGKEPKPFQEGDCP